MEQYIEHLKQILTSEHSQYKPNRTGIDSISLYGYQNEYDLRKGFPLVTTKKVYNRAIIHELIWFLRGDTNLKYLVDNKVRIWDEWAFDKYLEQTGQKNKYKVYSEEWSKAMEEYKNKIRNDEEFAATHGDLGPVYGKQWRKWQATDGNVIDQLQNVIDTLKRFPSSRRIIITAWNPEEVKDMALPPCHCFMQFNSVDGYLDLQLYQRSADTFLGVPFNISSYSMLLMIIAQLTGLKPRRFIHTFGDSHIYCGAGERGKFYGDNFEELKRKINAAEKRDDYLKVKEWIEENAPPEPKDKEGQDHVTAALEQMSREPRKLPKLKINVKPFDELRIEDFELEDYVPHPSIKRSVAV